MRWRGWRRGGGGGEEEEDEEEEERESPKSKNPTQRCGEQTKLKHERIRTRRKKHPLPLYESI